MVNPVAALFRTLSAVLGPLAAQVEEYGTPCFIEVTREEVVTDALKAVDRVDFSPGRMVKVMW